MPTWALREHFFDNPITVSHHSINSVAERYRFKVDVSRNSTSDGIINLSLHDTSPQRAADVLNEMINVYNENTIEEKKEIIRQTSDYINDRISQLDRDLGAQESQIASFKRENQILNLILIVLNTEICVTIANISQSQKTTQEKASRIELV